MRNQIAIKGTKKNPQIFLANKKAVNLAEEVGIYRSKISRKKVKENTLSAKKKSKIQEKKKERTLTTKKKREIPKMSIKLLP